MATSDEYDNYLLEGFYMSDTSSSYEINPISEITATMMTLQREIQQMRYDLTSNSVFSNYHRFSGFYQESQMASKFSTCEVCGEIGHMALECQVDVSFFQEPESKIFYMANYSNQSYNNQFNNIYDTD
jgi:hypothetical protein